MNLKHTNI